MSRMLALAADDESGPDALTAELLAISDAPLTSEELAGYAQALRAVSIPVPLEPAEHAGILDTCGTGGDVPAGATFNISTASAILAAACGVPVAKHGNRASTSNCGSADVVEALGIPLLATPEASAAHLRAHNFAFLYAPAFHPALAPLAPIRKGLGRRTIMNLLGPLANPAATKRQVIGVPARRLVPLVAGALSLLGTEHALVVFGEDGLDEITLTTATHVAEVRAGSAVREFTVTPEDFGFAAHTAACPYAGGNAQQNAAILTRLLTDPDGNVLHREIVVANTAAALIVAGRTRDFREGAALAAEALDSGAAGRKLIELQQQET